ncbi:MAG: gamma-glutamylcyclotransferase [Myxococcota bacterium]
MRPLWIFGYGSLIWRPSFSYVERRTGIVSGFARRFWQASPDHRGTPERPGRVVTLVPDPSEQVFGMLYRVEEKVVQTLDALDHRERGGYQRREVEAKSGDGSVHALMYWADESNPHFVGAAPLDAMVEQILGARGESGPNSEYVLKLDEALTEHGVHDPHIRTLSEALIRSGAHL